MNVKDRFVDYLIEAPNFISVFIFSLFFNIASPILIEISRSTNVETTDLSFVFTFFTVGAALGQMTSVLYNRRFKKMQVLISGFIILLLLTVALSFNSNQILLYVLYLLSGYLLGVIWIQSNQFILESKIRNKEILITIFLTFYPIGAFIAPFISSAIIRSGLSWRYIYYVIILLIVINIITYILIFRRKKESETVHEEAKMPLREVFSDNAKNKIFWVVFAAIILYCSSETIVATWAPTFFRLARGLAIQPASISLNLFWLFIIIGRIITMLFASKVRSTKIMAFISVIAIISMAAVVFVYSRSLIFILIALAGLGYSAMFPLLVSVGGTIYDKGRGILATFLFIASTVGTTIAPLITKFSSRINLTLSISFSFILMIFVTIMILLTIFLFAKKEKIEKNIIYKKDLEELSG